MNTENAVAIAVAFSTRKQFLVEKMDNASDDATYQFWRGRLVEMYDGYRSIIAALGNESFWLPTSLFNLTKY